MTSPFEPDWPVGARDMLGAVRRVRGGPGSRLVRELRRVECVELVRCFLEAASRRLRATRPFSRASHGDWFERLALRCGWRRRARAALWSLLGQGSDHEEFVFLADLLDRPVSTWPAASTILEHARLVGDGPAVAHAHARALELQSEPARALALYVAELDRQGGVRRFARVFESLARVHRSRGHERRALAPIVERCRDWPFRPAALAEALATALALSDASAAQRLAAALAPHAGDPRVEAAFYSAASESIGRGLVCGASWRATLAGLLSHELRPIDARLAQSQHPRSATPS